MSWTVLCSVYHTGNLFRIISSLSRAKEPIITPLCNWLLAKSLCSYLYLRYRCNKLRYWSWILLTLWESFSVTKSVLNIREWTSKTTMVRSTFSDPPKMAGSLWSLLDPWYPPLDPWSKGHWQIFLVSSLCLFSNSILGAQGELKTCSYFSPGGLTIVQPGWASCPPIDSWNTLFKVFSLKSSSTLLKELCSKSTKPQRPVRFPAKVL